MLHVTRLRLLTESESLLRRECDRSRQEVLSVEKAVRERISFLERAKDAALYKLQSLSEQLADTVAKDDHNTALARCDAIAKRYRELLESSTKLTDQTAKLDEAHRQVAEFKVLHCCSPPHASLARRANWPLPTAS